MWQITHWSLKEKLFKFHFFTTVHCKQQTNSSCVTVQRLLPEAEIKPHFPPFHLTFPRLVLTIVFSLNIGSSSVESLGFFSKCFVFTWSLAPFIIGNDSRTQSILICWLNLELEIGNLNMRKMRLYWRRMGFDWRKVV